jgi:hypothetical protein
MKHLYSIIVIGWLFLVWHNPYANDMNSCQKKYTFGTCHQQLNK